MIISEKLSVPWPQLPPFMGHSCIKTQIWISRFRTICFLKQRRGRMLPSYWTLVSSVWSPLSKVQEWRQLDSPQNIRSRSPETRGWTEDTDSQRWIPAQRGLYKTAAQTKTVCITFGIYSPNLCKVNDNQILLQQDNNRIRLLEICGDTEGTIIFNT